MAGTLSYVHAIVPVNISGLAHTIHAFRHDVHALKKLYTEKRQPSRFTHDDWFHQRIVDLFQLASADVDAMLVNIDSCATPYQLSLLKHACLMKHMNIEFDAYLLLPSSVELSVR